MQVSQILVEIDQEITRLTEVRNLLSGGTRNGARGKASASGGDVGNERPRRKNRLSAEARARIAAAQRKRWAAQRQAAKKAA
jgi:hypothetical protein